MKSSAQQILPESECLGNDSTCVTSEAESAEIAPQLLRLLNEKIVRHNDGLIELNDCKLDDAQFLTLARQITRWVPEKVQMLFTL